MLTDTLPTAPGPVITLANGKIYLKFQFDPELISKINKKTGIGFEWNKDTGYWSIPDNEASRQKVNSVFPATFKDEIRPDKSFLPNKLLLKHQVQGLRVAYRKKSFGFWYGCGSGKTFMALDIIKMYNLKTLVICPLTAVENAWIEDSIKFGYGRPITNLWAERKRSRKSFLTALKNCEIGVINRDIITTELQAILDAGFELLIIDESASFKDIKKSKRTKSAIKIADNIPVKYLLSGCPAPNGPHEYFSQCRIIDPTIFGWSYYKFLEKYFNQDWSKYTLKPEKETEFYEKLSRISITVKAVDVLDLPPLTKIVRKFKLADKEQSIYDKFKKDLFAETDNGDITVSNVIAKTIKLRQLCSGFFYNPDKSSITTGRSKLNELKDLISEIGNEQVLIWTQFQREADDLQAALGKNSLQCNGSVSTKVQNEAIAAFKCGQCQYLIAHPGTIKYAITFKDCQYMIYYSLPNGSLDDYTQSLHRIHRLTQESSCFCYHMTARNTVEPVIYDAMVKKEDVANKVLDYLKRSV